MGALSGLAVGHRLGILTGWPASLRRLKRLRDLVADACQPAVLGASARFWATSRLRELDQVRSREREQLARELHDTVAHHVSAMVIRAQAGRVVAESRPGAAVDALKVIEAEGSLTLAEM